MYDEKTILSRFKNLIDRSCVSRQKIAESIGCDTSTITKHYNGDRSISTEYVIKYAQFFNVSTDYLLGLTAAPTTDKDLRYICDYTGLSENAVKELKADREMSVYWNSECADSFCDIASEFISSGTFDKIICMVSNYVVNRQKHDEYKEKPPCEQNNDELELIQLKKTMALFELQETTKDFALDYSTSADNEKYNKEYFDNLIRRTAKALSKGLKKGGD